MVGAKGWPDVNDKFIKKKRPYPPNTGDPELNVKE
jgi:hypothetical protein